MSGYLCEINRCLVHCRLLSVLRAHGRRHTALPTSGLTQVDPTRAREHKRATASRGAPAPGVQLWVNGSPVDVVGVLAPAGDPLIDQAVFFSRAVGSYLVNVVDSYLLIRAPEIALRRAMGASRASVWRIFTYEGVLIGLAGGVLGDAAGVGLE